MNGILLSAEKSISRKLEVSSRQRVAAAARVLGNYCQEWHIRLREAKSEKVHLHSILIVQ